MAVDITAFSYCLDDFCKAFADWEVHQLIPSEQTRKRSGKLSRSEMLFIMVLFHLSAFKNFKTFYLSGIGQQHRTCFLKSEMGLEPTRHRSVINAMVHVLPRRLRRQTRQAFHFAGMPKDRGLSVVGIMQ